MKRLTALAPGVAILLVALAVRLPTLTAALPYFTYVDEGHVLHRVVHLLEKETWEPNTYSYPSLPFYLIAGAALAYSPVYEAIHGRPLREALSASSPRYYDILEPPDLIVLGRLITLAFSLGVVVLAGLLARRLAGSAAGLLAAWLAALVPALVARSAIVNINPIMAFFVLAALLFAEGAHDPHGENGHRPRRDAALAGVMTGLAAATKYPAVLVCLPVALAVLLADASWRERLTRLLLAGGAAITALLIVMPALWLRTGEVLAGLREMSLVYGVQQIGSYWEQATRRGEWDLPLEHPEMGIAFLLLAGAGVVVGLRDDRWSRPVLGWLLFATVTGLLVDPYKFRAFRNLLALVPLACVTTALLYARLRRSVRRPVWVDLAAVALPVLLFAPALQPYIRHQLQLEDSREQAVRWLADHIGPEHRVLVTEELAILPSRMAALKAGEVDVRHWGRAKDRIFNRRFHYVVLGTPTRARGGSRITPPVRDRILRNYEVAARFGHYPTYAAGVVFNGNGQLVFILKRVPRAPRSLPPRGAARRSSAP